MAKRYHQSKAARHREHMGMERRERGPVRGHHADHFNDEHHHSSERSGFIFKEAYEPYAGNDARRTQEMQDAGMIRENPSAIANLPQEVMIKAYPKTGPYLPEGLDDTIYGIDRQMDYDDKQRRAHFYPKKH